MTPSTERVSPVKRSEAKWLHTLYMTHAETLYRVARYRLQDPERAKDLVHCVFLAAAEKVSLLQTHENPWAWLLRALNYELSHEFARLEKERKALPLEELREHPQPPPSLGLAEILPAQLPPRDREVLLLYYEEGLSYQEIGAALSLEEGTVKSRISRAKRQLRTILAEGNLLGEPDVIQDRRGAGE